MDIINSNEEVIHLGIRGTELKHVHAGHRYLQDECRNAYPNAKLLLQVYQPIDVIWNTMLAAFHKNYETQSWSKTEPYPRALFREWARNRGIDYLLEMSAAEIRAFPKPQRGLAQHLPNYNMSFTQEEFSALREEARQIIQQDELHMYVRNPLANAMTLFCLMAVLSGKPDYKIRCAGTKDGWMHRAKQYIYETYSDVEYFLVDALKDTNGLPVRADAETKRIATDWHLNQKTERLTPKWLGGKSYYEYEVELTSGKRILVNQVR